MAAGLVLVASASGTAESQSMAERLRQKAKERLEAKADQAIDKGLDKLEGTVNCLVGDSACIAKAKKDGKTVKTHKSQEELDEANREKEEAIAAAKAEQAEKAAAAKANAAPAAQAVDTKVWENFDFIPGERILFADDFAKDRVGNFPQRLQLVEGNAQVVEARGARWLQGTSNPVIVRFNLPEELPRRWTMEFDMVLGGGFPLKVGIKTDGEADPDFTAGETRAFIGAFQSGLAGGGVNSATSLRIDGKERDELAGTAVRVRLHADGEYMKVYVNERRISNVPNTKWGRAKQLVLQAWGTDESPSLAGNFTIAAGGRSLYDALLENGRVATQGILFDTGSDRIRPESAPTLKLIGDMLKEHGDLKLLIEGHTDNVGSAPSNLTLSDKRSAAVKAYLTGTFGIDGSRLQTKGFGDTKPAAPNTTNEGKQQNRRVELVKLP